MINLSSLNIDVKSLGDEMLLVDIAAVADVKDGKKTGKNAGYKYVVALPEHKLEKISVKIPGHQRVQLSDDGYKKVAFDGLEVKAYVIEGKPVLSAKATEIREVK